MTFVLNFNQANTGGNFYQFQKYSICTLNETLLYSLFMALVTCLLSLNKTNKYNLCPLTVTDDPRNYLLQNSQVLQGSSILSIQVF
jgi:hypothetical protein